VRKTMKKISLLIALSLILTIGGVYAAWNYAQGNVQNAIDSMDVGIGKNIYITPAELGNSKGTISVDASAAVIAIDDADNNHVAEVSYTGDIVITFTPAAGVDADVAANGIKLQYTLVCSGGWEYNGTAIFASEATAHTLNGGVATKSVTIPASEWSSLLTFNGGSDLSLPTADDYQIFHDALHTGMITITVSEAP